MQLFDKPLTWINEPSSYHLKEDSIAIEAGAKTDLFSDPTGDPIFQNSPLLLFQGDEHFQFSARLTAALAAKFDAAALVVYAHKECWAKLCFELSPEHEPMLVTVVTNKDASDDCNHRVIDKESVHLRIAGLGDGVFAFHISETPGKWDLVRYFSLDHNHFQIGFSAQSPTGLSCKGRFVDVAYASTKLKELRTGE